MFRVLAGFSLTRCHNNAIDNHIYYGVSRSALIKTSTVRVKYNFVEPFAGNIRVDTDERRDESREREERVELSKRHALCKSNVFHKACKSSSLRLQILSLKISFGAVLYMKTGEETF